jgi:predicted ABC-type transport system involved in lysophospholipase L1 biosynthesis ATPase subunit
LHQDGITIVLVTHDAAVAERSQRIVRIEDGRTLAAAGEPAVTCSQTIDPG